jgi:hypothetical protein
MKKAVMLPLVAAISGAMVGCGGGGGGGSSAPAPTVYTISFVKLEVAKESELKSGCAIYGEYEQPAVVSNLINAMNAPQEKMYVYGQVADRGFNVVVHDDKGKLASGTTFIPNSNGQIRVDMSKIPTNGYLTIEEEQGSTTQDVQIHSLSIQKQYLQNMTVAVRTFQASSNKCVSGSGSDVDKTATLDETAAIDTATVAATQGYMTSSAALGLETAHTSASSGIAVLSKKPNDRDILVTAYTNSTASSEDPLKSEKLTNPNGYAFATKDTVYFDGDNSRTDVVKLKAIEDPIVNYNVSGLSSMEAGVVTVVNNNKVYHWQPLFSDSMSYAYTSDSVFAKWAMNIEGKSTSGWDYQGLFNVNGSVKSINVPSTSNSSSISITNCSDTGTGYCFSQGSFDSTIDGVRYNVRTRTTYDRSVSQSIYGKPNRNQPLMQASRSGVEIDFDPARDVLETSLFASSNDTAASGYFFLSQHTDYQNLTELYDYDTHKYLDYVGVLPLNSVSATQYMTMMGADTSLLQTRK